MLACKAHNSCMQMSEVLVGRWLLSSDSQLTVYTAAVPPCFCTSSQHRSADMRTAPSHTLTECVYSSAIVCLSIKHVPQVRWLSPLCTSSQHRSADMHIAPPHSLTDCRHSSAIVCLSLKHVHQVQCLFLLCRSNRHQSAAMQVALCSL